MYYAVVRRRTAAHLYKILAVKYESACSLLFLSSVLPSFLVRLSN